MGTNRIASYFSARGPAAPDDVPSARFRVRLKVPVTIGTPFIELDPGCTYVTHRADAESMARRGIAVIVGPA